MPSDDYVGQLYSSLALQYTQFYNGLVERGEALRMLSKKNLSETVPEFATDTEQEELEDYMVYDAEYRKTVPVSRLMNNKKKLSEDERRMRRALLVALEADERINAELAAKEEEARRLERERRYRSYYLPFPGSRFADECLCLFRGF